MEFFITRSRKDGLHRLAQAGHFGGQPYPSDDSAARAARLIAGMTPHKITREVGR